MVCPLDKNADLESKMLYKMSSIADAKSGESFRKWRKNICTEGKKCKYFLLHSLKLKIYPFLICSYTEPEVARRLLSQGHVLVGHARVAVKEMDGQPALFNN